MSILRQQYRRIPSSSSTLMGLSPALTRRLNVSHLSAICLPQVKHLTGMIIFFHSPVRFLFSSSCAWPTELLGFGYSLVSGKHYSVEGNEVLSQLAALCPRGKRSRDGDSGRFGLAHETSTLNGYADVHSFGSVPRYDQCFLDLHPDDLGTNIVERMIVKVD